jgi:hypothetical protein
MIYIAYQSVTCQIKDYPEFRVILKVTSSLLMVVVVVVMMMMMMLLLLLLLF